MGTVVYFQDRFVDDAEAARIPLLDRGHLLGDGVFATLRGYDGVCFRSAEHVADLARGAGLFGLTLGHDEAELVTLLDEVARRTGDANAYVRATVTRAADGVGSTLSIVGHAYDLPSDDAYRAGVPTKIVRLRRPPPACFDGSVKSTSYAGPVLARREAEAHGAFEGIQRSIEGDVACGAMANVFTIDGARLSTPPLRTGCRNGVTRRALQRISGAEGLVFTERTLSVEDLLGAEEVFLASTRVECLPVSAVDDRKLGSSHPRTEMLRRRLQSEIHEDTASRRRA